MVADNTVTTLNQLARKRRPHEVGEGRVHLEFVVFFTRGPFSGSNCWEGGVYSGTDLMPAMWWSNGDSTRRGSYPSKDCGVSVFITEVVDALKTLQSKNLRPAIYHANAVLNACSRGKWSHDVIGMSFGNGIIWSGKKLPGLIRVPTYVRQIG